MSTKFNSDITLTPIGTLESGLPVESIRIGDLLIHDINSSFDAYAETHGENVNRGRCEDSDEDDEGPILEVDDDNDDTVFLWSFEHGEQDPESGCRGRLNMGDRFERVHIYALTHAFSAGVYKLFDAITSVRYNQPPYEHYSTTQLYSVILTPGDCMDILVSFKAIQFNAGSELYLFFRTCASEGLPVKVGRTAV